MDARTQEFLAYVQARRAGRGDGLAAGRVPAEADQVHRDARQLGADGRAARARVDPARADAAAQARADREGAGRGRPRAADLPRRRGPRQAARRRCSPTCVSGKAKFHNVFHYPTKTWGDVGVIAWLVDAAAIISQKALLKCSYAPYARIMKKICWEESFHILHGRDVILAMVTGTDEQRELVQEALNRWWGPLMQFHGNPISRDEDPMYVWRIKSQGNEEARQQFLEGYVPQIWELGLTVPDPKLRRTRRRRLGVQRARLGRAEVGRHRPRPALAGAARVPPRASSSRRSGCATPCSPRDRSSRSSARSGRGSRSRTRARSRRRTRRSPRRGRASSTAGAASRRRCGSCRATRCTRSPTGRTSSTSSTAASTATRSRHG